MGRAQVVQAQAAGVEPDVRMNPILLKPSSDVGSQVIVNGKARGQMSAADYFRMKRSLIPDILEAYNSLAAENDIIVIEGAGSPAEINLKADDIVNMGLAKLVDAPVLLAGDIDRGGVFAQLYGTVELLEADERARIKGLIINKFRGDVEILRPGLAMLEEKTQLPVLGVVPYLRVEIEDEDSLSPSGSKKRRQAAGYRHPAPAAYIQLHRLYPAGTAPAAGRAVCAAHPPAGRAGSRHPARHQEHHGRPALAAGKRAGSGGAQAFGSRYAGAGRVRRLSDAGRTALRPGRGGERHPCTLRGLGLLPTTTVFGTEKHLTQTAACVTAEPFAGAKLTGYEIHAGRTEVRGSAFCTLADGTPEGCVQDGVFGTYLHGLFDTGELTEKLTAFLCKRKGIDPPGAELIPMEQYRQQQFDLLADGVRAALDMPAIYAAMGMQKGDNT